uniref:Uncharacterized protein n=1 Tax=Anguilla anguilla TaxID=7936 RepID=A0A0E9XT32_ANGAN
MCFNNASCCTAITTNDPPASQPLDHLHAALRGYMRLAYTLYKLCSVEVCE